MALYSFFIVLLGVATLTRSATASDSGLQIEVQHLPEQCEAKAEKGQWVGVHYIGKLSDGTEFDNSYSRNKEIEFQLGEGQVIAGWEEGIEGMCINEKRRLIIPPHLGYGEEGIGPIPGGATLVFDVELVRTSEQPVNPPEGDEDGGYDVYQEGFEADGEQGFEEGGYMDVDGSAFTGEVEDQ